MFHRVQELISDDQRESGRIPRTIECELTQDLVDSCVPGDMVTITGVVKVSSEEGNAWHGMHACMQNPLSTSTTDLSTTTQTHCIPKIEQRSDESAVGG